nr:unnamed protein product [Digitaria exilis]
MGYLWRVRLSSFAAGAATASAAGFFLLYKDHLLARATITRQVRPPTPRTHGTTLSPTSWSFSK